MGISIWQLLIVLLVVVVLFGTKKLRNMGSDLGEAVKGFKKGMKNDSESASEAARAIESTASEADATETKQETTAGEASTKST